MLNEDEIVSGIRELVLYGEYLDQLPGLLESRQPSGAGVWSQAGESRWARIYRRGSLEYFQARAAGLIEPLPSLRTASPEAIKEAEEVIGYPLPSLLRRLYLEVGNGGFGPGYGLLGVRGGHHDDLGKTAVDEYIARRSERYAEKLGEWPKSLFPLCHWGCAIYSIVDCASPNAAMWAWDPNGVTDEQLPKALFAESNTLANWFEAWLNGTLRQPGLVLDPSTGEARPATTYDLEGS